MPAEVPATSSRRRIDRWITPGKVIGREDPRVTSVKVEFDKTGLPDLIVLVPRESSPRGTKGANYKSVRKTRVVAFSFSSGPLAEYQSASLFCSRGALFCKAQYSATAGSVPWSRRIFYQLLRASLVCPRPVRSAE